MTKLLLLTALVAAPFATAACRAADQPRAQLPKLTRAVTIDGDPGDWAGAGAVSVPVWSESDICYRASGYQWRGPADVSMEVYCGWRPEGFYFAAIVADDKVENLRTDGAIYWEDSIGFCLDGRVGQEFGKSSYTRGAWQATITPPLPGRDVVAGANGLEGGEEELTVAGKATPTGYIIEALIPWRTFPDFTPQAGAVMAFNFAVNDYDGSDPKAERPVQLNAGAAKDLYLHADRLIQWELVETLHLGQGVALGPLVTFPSPAVLAAGMPPQLTVAIGTLLAPRVGSMRFIAAGWDGHLLFDRTVAASPAPAPWGGGAQATLDWPEDVALPSGVVMISVTVNGRDGGVLGTATRRVLVQGAQGDGG